MKLFKFLFNATVVCLTSLVFYSCLDDNDGYSLGDLYKPEVVTLVPISETAFYFRLDDGATFWPVNQHGYKVPKEETRVLLNFTILGDSIDKYSHAIKINRIDYILTKQMAEDKGEENDSVYGTDPVRIIGMWVGDGYLNVYFEAIWGGKEKHFINLLNPNPEKPYDLEFRHNAFNDPKVYRATSIVAFDISSMDIEEGTESIELNVTVKDFDGEKTHKVKYTPNKEEKVSSLSFNDTVLLGMSK